MCIRDSTEDVQCTDEARHTHDTMSAPFCRVLCDCCRIPICKECSQGLLQFESRRGVSTIPMSLANDNYYGYAARLLSERSVTWLECACASLVWTTVMVYYLEEPYGHLMLDSMEGAQARTQVRGNLFSFSLPWEDIEKQCLAADADWLKTLKAARSAIALPHSEEVLAALVNVHIVGGEQKTSCSTSKAPRCARAWSYS